MMASDMADVSPTDSASTNKGGRPLDWTAQRTRKLTRLYLFTKLCLGDILILMETHDSSGWRPTETAARKTLNRLFGYGPRWVRPNNPEEQLRRFGSLKRSGRGSKSKLQRRNTAVMEYLDHAMEEVNTYDDPMDYIPCNGFDEPPPLDFFSNTPYNYDPHPEMIRRSSTRQFTFSDYCPPVTGEDRVDTGLTDSTTYTVATDVMKRLKSQPPTDTVKDAMRLLKRFTLSDNEATQSPGLSLNGFRNSPYTARGQPTDDYPFYAGLAVPGDFLNIDLFQLENACRSTPSKAHQTGVCWCKVEATLTGSAENSWPSALDPWDEKWLDEYENHVDEFGNTIFHFCASRDRFQSILADRAIEAAFTGIGMSLVSRKNTAGQTFLHTLHHSWYEDGQPLFELIAKLHKAGFDILATDVYGRHCFHHMKRHNVDLQIMQELVSTLNLDHRQVDRRDAFGCKPLASPMPLNPERNSSRLLRKVLITNRLNPSKPTRLEIPSSTTVSEARIQEEAGLLRIITTALAVDRLGPEATPPNPHQEDAQGRNGFHCLAEVILGNEHMAAHAFGAPSPKKSNSKKRKRGSAANNEVKQSDEDDSPANNEAKLRAKYVKSLQDAGVDPESYDCRGYTPLMTFVERREDSMREEQKSLELILHSLVSCSSSSDRELFLERRNRRGETALHVAVRLGRIHAVKFLLNAGANPNTRNSDGLGLLEVITRLYNMSEDDDGFSARIMACRAQISSLKDVSLHPTIVDEWRSKEKH